MMAFQSFIISSMLLCAFVVNTNAQDRLEIYSRNSDGSIEHYFIDNVQRFSVQKNNGEITSMRIKRESGEWFLYPLRNAIGYSHYKDNMDEPETYRFVENDKYGFNAGKIRLIEGDIDGAAIFKDRIFLYLIYFVVWDNTYYIQKDGNLTELKSKSQIENTLSNSCLSQRIRHSQRSINYLVTKDESTGSSPLFEMLMECEN